MIAQFDASTLSWKEKRKLEKPLEAFISKITKDGKVNVGFSNYMIVPTNYKQIFNGIAGAVKGSTSDLARRLQDNSEIISLDILPGNEELEE